MKLTTKNIIKLIPINEELRSQLLVEWDTLDEDRKFEIGRLVWNAYYDMYDLNKREKIQLHLEKVKNGEEHLQTDFYANIIKETQEEMQKEGYDEKDTSELEDVRKKLSQLMVN